MFNPITTLPKLIKSKKPIDQIEDNWGKLKMNPSNWRTTANGIIAALLQLSQIWIPPTNIKAISTVHALTALFIALGLYNAADKQNV